MVRQIIAKCLSSPLPPPTQPSPNASPLQTRISELLNADKNPYDAICLPLTTPAWQERWERLCLRPMDDEDGNEPPEVLAEREQLDREADLWRREGGLRREGVTMTRLEETQNLLAMASEWLELDSQDEGIRFDSELVSEVFGPLSSHRCLTCVVGSTSRVCICPVPRSAYPHTACPNIRQSSLSLFLRSSSGRSAPNGRFISFYSNLNPHPHL